MSNTDRLIEKYETLYNRHKDGEVFSPDELQDLHIEIENQWSACKYPIHDVMDFIMVTTIIFQSANDDPKLLKTMFSKANIKIMPKDLQKGRTGLINRYFRSYHKEKTRMYLIRRIRDVPLFRYADLIRKEPTKVTLERIIEKLNFETTQAIVYCILKEESVISLLREIDFQADVMDRLLSYVWMHKYKYHKIMEAPETLERDRVDVRKLSTEKKQLERQLSKSERMAQQLKKNLHEEMACTKLLKADMYNLHRSMEEILADSIAEVERLEQKLYDMQRSFELEREFYLRTIKALAEPEAEDESFDEYPDIDLSGKTICVIGGARERHYRDIVRKYKGSFSFVASNNPSKLDGRVKGSDVVFCLKDIVSHSLFDETVRAASAYNVPFVLVKTLGITTFERNLKNYAIHGK